MKSVVLVLGEERFLAREAVRALLEKHPEHDLSRYDGKGVELGHLLDELKTPSLFGKGRAVVVTDAGPLLEGEELRTMASYAESAVPGTLLVLQAARVDGRLKAAKALKAAARVIECKPLHQRDVCGWICERGREAYGLEVEPAAARALRQRIGEELGLLDAALVRLRDQIGPRTTRLAADDIIESTEEQRSPILFEAANALEAADLDAALEAVGTGFAEGIRIRTDTVSDPRAVAPILLGNLHAAYRKLLRFHMLGGTDKLGISPQAAHHFRRRAARHQLSRLVARHHLFLEADLALKRSTDEPRRIVEHLVVGLLA